MTWNDAMKAAALAAETERKATDAARAVDTPWRWNAHDVWLSRAGQSHARDMRPQLSDPVMQSRQDTARRD